MTQDSFIEALLPAGFGRNQRLDRISGLIDWDRLAGLIRKVRPGETGRPPYEPLAMFKALLLQQWYGLSDPGLEEALLDRVSFRRFCGFALDAQTPDETTLCRFRNALQQAGLGEALFQEVLRQLEAAGYVLKTGTLIDATLVQSSGRTPASGSTPRETESRSAHDPEANWTRHGKGRKLFFGYKAHISVDQGSGLIRARKLTGAKTAESEVADDLVLGDEKAVYADKAYEKRARRQALKARGIKDRIQHRRNKHQKALQRWQSVRNKLIGRVRQAVERTFSQIKGRYRLSRMRYAGIAANAFHLDLISIAYNLRTAAAIR
ncbi:IS5 family transposase [Rhodopseudomonas sp. HC1]|uniref:IS5 family transposase n=1 Tax=Rhodopseudomonas infernalis TaxID=2897386 RepID=UPI001EE8B537|nr:IS5 family transposase [Rhodopseudomonas infernalis]MCG6207979.1 IS5 family transposase [Rhodopseudomonas infernalis]